MKLRYTKTEVEASRAASPQISWSRSITDDWLKLWDKINRLQTINDELLAACNLTTNICELVGHCAGEWTVEHRSLAQEYAAKGRLAIAKADEEEHQNG